MKTTNIDMPKTIKWKKLVKEFGEFCWVNKHGGSNSYGLYEVRFDFGTLWQKNGFILAAEYEGSVYLNMNADLNHLPKYFVEHVLSWRNESFGVIVWPKD